MTAFTPSAAAWQPRLTERDGGKTYTRTLEDMQKQSRQSLRSSHQEIKNDPSDSGNDSAEATDTDSDSDSDSDSGLRLIR